MEAPSCSHIWAGEINAMSGEESNGKNKEFSFMTWIFKLHLASNSRLALMLQLPLNIHY